MFQYKQWKRNNGREGLFFIIGCTRLQIASDAEDVKAGKEFWITMRKPDDKQIAKMWSLSDETTKVKYKIQ